MSLIQTQNQQTTVEEELNTHFHDYPAIMLAGRIHARESITGPLVMYSLLSLLHGGIIHDDLQKVKLLEQNKYYFMPTVNVDGLAMNE